MVMRSSAFISDEKIPAQRVTQINTQCGLMFSAAATLAASQKITDPDLWGEMAARPDPHPVSW